LKYRFNFDGNKRKLHLIYRLKILKYYICAKYCENNQENKIFIFRLCPIFQVSNVSGENLELLKMFLNLLTTRNNARDDEPAEFQIDDMYSVPVSFVILLSRILVFKWRYSQGVGTVVSGTTLAGTIRLNDTLLLGPDLLGHFTPIAIKSIHRKRMPVREVRSGQTASFALKKVGNFIS